jgi:hypothetical protein
LIAAGPGGGKLEAGIRFERFHPEHHRHDLAFESAPDGVPRGVGDDEVHGDLTTGEIQVESSIRDVLCTQGHRDRLTGCDRVAKSQRQAEGVCAFVRHD